MLYGIVCISSIDNVKHTLSAACKYKVPVNYHTKCRLVTAIYMSTYAHTHMHRCNSKPEHLCIQIM